jgi:hypothetical protein
MPDSAGTAGRTELSACSRCNTQQVPWRAWHYCVRNCMLAAPVGAQYPRVLDTPVCVTACLLYLQVHSIPRSSLFIQTKFTPIGGQDRSQPLPYDPAAPLPEQVRPKVDSHCLNQTYAQLTPPVAEASYTTRLLCKQQHRYQSRWGPAVTTYAASSCSQSTPDTTGSLCKQQHRCQSR